ncbi:GntR family transcriptional regulator [Paraburkholderia sp. BR13439]|uniref:GntR family transcriptional regulator n=1 Tax=unclassified Paraburkholderia TaxID=2615204 RepID=UPI0034CF9ECF
MADKSTDIFTPEDLDQRLPKTAQVYELLRHAIVSCRLPPGEVLNEKELSRQLDISRTPIREAILQLAAQKLIVIKSSSGTYVSPIRLNDVLEGQLVRDGLEARTVALAARYCTSEYASRLDVSLYQQRLAAKAKDTDQFYALDEEFHKLICDCSGFPSLWTLLNGAKGQLDRVRRLAFPVQAHFDEVVKEHTALINAIKGHDEERAVVLMRTHVDAIETLEHLIRKRRNLFHGDVTQDLQRFKDVLRTAQHVDE